MDSRGIQVARKQELNTCLTYEIHIHKVTTEEAAIEFAQHNTTAQQHNSTTIQQQT